LRNSEELWDPWNQERGIEDPVGIPSVHSSGPTRRQIQVR